MVLVGCDGDSSCDECVEYGPHDCGHAWMWCERWFLLLCVLLHGTCFGHDVSCDVEHHRDPDGELDDVLNVVFGSDHHYVKS